MSVLSNDLPKDLSVLPNNHIPKDIQNIIDDYSSSYDHYLLTLKIIEEYHTRVTTLPYKTHIKFDQCEYNWRHKYVYGSYHQGNYGDKIYKIGPYMDPVRSGILPRNYL